MCMILQELDRKQIGLVKKKRFSAGSMAAQMLEFCGTEQHEVFQIMWIDVIDHTFHPNLVH